MTDENQTSDARAGRLGASGMGGAITPLYDGPVNVDLVYSAPIANLVGYSGAWSEKKGGYGNPIFSKEEATWFAGSAKFIGIGVGFAVVQGIDNSFSLRFDGSIIAGGTLDFKFVGFDLPEVTSNGYLSIESVARVNVVGLALGAGVAAKYDKGAIVGEAQIDLGVVAGRISTDPYSLTYPDPSWEQTGRGSPPGVSKLANGITVSATATFGTGGGMVASGRMDVGKPPTETGLPPGVIPVGGAPPPSKVPTWGPVGIPSGMVPYLGGGIKMSGSAVFGLHGTTAMPVAHVVVVQVPTATRATWSQAEKLSQAAHHQGLNRALQVENGDIRSYQNSKGETVGVTGSGDRRQLEHYGTVKDTANGKQHTYSWADTVAIMADTFSVNQNGGKWGRVDGTHGNARTGKGAGAFESGRQSITKDGKSKTKPILLDLDGDGIELVDLSRSTMQVDSAGDGLLHRTAWAGSGDGVLFIDADGNGMLSNSHEYVFTEWAGGAADDLDALRKVFDSNGDGKLTSADARWGEFRVLVTQADGSKVTRTLAELGITEINLTADATTLVSVDGSAITGQAKFKMGGVDRTVANTRLIAEVAGHRVVEAVTVDGAGQRVVVQTGYDKLGDKVFVTTSVTSANGLSISNSHDLNGDGVVDRLQTIQTVLNGNGSRTETVINKQGSNPATAVLLNRTVTTTSADGKQMTIQRDKAGGGWFDQSEVRATAGDGSRTLVISDLARDGSVIRSSSETISVSGMLRSRAENLDGQGGADRVVTETITTSSGARTEVTAVTNGDGSARSSETVTVSADGKTRVVTADVNADGLADRVATTVTSLAGNGSNTSVETIRNRDTSLRAQQTTTVSADGLTTQASSDTDGNGGIDRVVQDVTLAPGAGSHTNRHNRRFRCYVSRRLITKGRDPSGWRLPAPQLVALVLADLRNHLHRQAQAHEILITPEAGSALQLSKAASDLADHPDPGQLWPLIETIHLEPGRLRIAPNRSKIARRLGLQIEQLSPALTGFEQPFTQRHRGVETKLISDNTLPRPDATLQKNLAWAHTWAKALRLGQSLAQIAVSERLLAKLLQTRATLGVSVK